MLNGKKTLKSYIIDGNEEKVKDFIESSDADVNELLDDEWPALMFACRHGKNSIAELLIHKGANVNFIDSVGRSPISEAAAQKNIDLVGLLKQKNANFKEAEQELKKHSPLGIIASIQPPAKNKDINSYNQMINFLLNEKIYPTKEEAKKYIKIAGNFKSQEAIDTQLIKKNIQLLRLQYPKKPSNNIWAKETVEEPIYTENNQTTIPTPVQPITLKAF
jgi:ankyrin repeat protein